MALNNPQLEREVLEGILSGLANDPGDYIADKAVPMTATKFGKGSISTLSAGSHFGLKGETGRRLPGGQVQVGPGLGFGAVNYDIELFDRANRVPYELVKRSQIPVPVLQMYLADIVHFLRVGREQRLADLITGTTWAANTALAGGDIWDTATSDPVQDISDAIDAIKGGAPNTIIMGRDTWNVLRTNSTVLAALNTTMDRAMLSPSAFANAVASHFGIPEDRIFVGRAEKLSSNNPEDVDDPTKLGAIHGDYFWVGRIGSAGIPLDGGDLLMSPSAIARVQESDLADNYMQYDEPAYKSWVVQAGVGEDLLAVTAGLGSLVTNCKT
jgi:hypothetical protein